MKINNKLSRALAKQVERKASELAIKSSKKSCLWMAFEPKVPEILLQKQK